jgi:hypothetical protein
VSSDPDEGYVHRPNEGDASDASPSSPSPASTDAENDAPTPDADPTTDGDRAPLPGPEPTGFGDRGWVLVATVVLSFLVIPGIIYLRPALPGEAGLSFIVAMLVLPLAPAVLLGLTAVWSMRESRRR